MPVFRSDIDVASSRFAENRAAHLKLIADLRAIEARIRGQGLKAAAKFAARGQLPPRDRIDLLLDRGSAWLELSTLCGLGCHDDDGSDGASGGGRVSGIGMVGGIRVCIDANDSAIKGGAATPYGLDKCLRLQQIALENRLPYIQLVESAGANLLRQAELFVRGGATFANLARLSAAGCPVISVVHGSSTAGGAYQPGLSDYVIVVRGKTKIFLAGPPLLKAATGEISTDEELGGAEMHANISGLAEWIAEDDRDAIRLARALVDKLKWDRAPQPMSAPQPLYDPEEMLGIVPPDYRKPYDVREVIARIVDGSDWLDFKASYGPATVCGFARVEGYEAGFIGNNGPIDPDGATKAAHFMQVCAQSGTPLVFLQNTTGFIVGPGAERAGIVKHGSKMIQAVTNAPVPKITLHIGASFGAGNYGMCGRAFGPRFIFAWPNNRISVMGGEQAAKVMTIIAEDGARRAGKEPPHELLATQAQKIIDQYDAESTALYATARLWDDGIIDPRDSRRILGMTLAICREAETRNLKPNTFGVGRM